MFRTCISRAACLLVVVAAGTRLVDAQPPGRGQRPSWAPIPPSNPDVIPVGPGRQADFNLPTPGQVVLYRGNLPAFSGLTMALTATTGVLNASVIINDRAPCNRSPHECAAGANVTFEADAAGNATVTSAFPGVWSRAQGFYLLVANNGEGAAAGNLVFIAASPSPSPSAAPSGLAFTPAANPATDGSETTVAQGTLAPNGTQIYTIVQPQGHQWRFRLNSTNGNSSLVAHIGNHGLPLCARCPFRSSFQVRSQEGAPGNGGGGGGGGGNGRRQLVQQHLRCAAIDAQRRAAVHRVDTVISLRQLQSAEETYDGSADLPPAYSATTYYVVLTNTDLVSSVDYSVGLADATPTADNGAATSAHASTLTVAAFVVAGAAVVLQAV